MTNWKYVRKDIYDKSFDLTKKYYVFEYSMYYPAGGLEDLSKTFDDILDALSYAHSSDYDYVTIFDRETGGFINIRE
jgi:hypothetical protein